MEKYKFTIQTARDNNEDQYGSREIVTCAYTSSCRCLKEAMYKASKYAEMQRVIEDCDSVISVEVERYEEDA